ncbi:hypothetical protein NEUTE2DRAFT_54317 [Neurospora tetrasperma FGSC 2509]|nr:hypothetical protein NEUTE2DRAFT_54317 [Neurospora tetrasperma FGSC 2509]
MIVVDLGYLPFRNNKTRIPSHRRKTEREKERHHHIKKNSGLIHLSTHLRSLNHPSSSPDAKKLKDASSIPMFYPTSQHFLFFPLVSAFDLDRVQSSNEDEWSYSKPNQCKLFHPHV